MSVKIGINGFGRIGRSVFRILSDRDDIEVVAINDLFENDQLVYLLKYDSVMRVFPKEVTADEDFMYVDGKKIAMTAEKDPAQIPWGDAGSGHRHRIDRRLHQARGALQKHLDGGAKKVILTVPAKDEIDATIVVGVNDHTLKPEHRLVSNASCTTNCLAPLAKILHETLRHRGGLHHHRPRLHQRPAPGRRPPQGFPAQPRGGPEHHPHHHRRRSGRGQGAARSSRASWTAWPCACPCPTAPSSTWWPASHRSRTRGRSTPPSTKPPRDHSQDRRVQRGAAGLHRHHRQPPLLRLRRPLHEARTATATSRSWPGTTTSGATPTGWWI